MSTIEHHYGQSAQGGLIGAITAGLAAMGRSPESVTLDDLGRWTSSTSAGARQPTV
jgi:hypothetical protein